MAPIFSPKVYTGIDISTDRINEALEKYPGYDFRICSIFNPEFIKFCQQTEFFFCAAVLHHFSNSECCRLFNTIKTYSPRQAVFIVLEPYRPDNFRQNPFSAIMARLDRGKYVRTKDEWLDLFGKNLKEVVYLKGKRNWPVDGAIYVLKFSKSH